MSLIITITMLQLIMSLIIMSLIVMITVDNVTDHISLIVMPLITMIQLMSLKTTVNQSNCNRRKYNRSFRLITPSFLLVHFLLQNDISILLFLRIILLSCESAHHTC